jgi:hypothetical protein
MSLPLVVTGRVAQCLRVLGFARVDLADGRVAFLYVQEGKVAPGDDLSGEDLAFAGPGHITNLTRNTPVMVEVTRVLARSELFGLPDTAVLTA